MENLPSIKQVGLFQLTRSLQEIDEKLDLVCRDGEIFEITPEQLKELIASKADASCDYLDWLDSISEAASARIETFKKIKQIADNKTENFKKYLMEALKQSNMTEIPGHTRKIKMKKPTASVEIIDPDQVPLEFIETVQEVKIRKKEIGDSLKNGVDVPGCRLKYTEGLLIK